MSYRIMVIGKGEKTNWTELLNCDDIETYRGFREAAYYLQRLSEESDQFPEIIVGYYDKENAERIADFGKFLNSHAKLAIVPFILMEAKGEIQGGAKYNPIPGLDDIVRNSISAEEFFNKVSLLKKFKSLEQRRSKFNGSSIEVPEDRRTIYKIDTFFKRIMDILIASVALLILFPFLVLIAITILVDSRGPIFYTSFRAGSNYRIFKFIKFRTMVVEADHKLSNLKERNQYAPGNKNEPVFFKISNDPRITRIGKLLRNTSLDELPQLLNVLKGDMSLVGNRPLPLYEAKTLTTDRHAERFNAPAGITGLWQISKRGQKEMSVEERIALDIDYARHNSFVQDIQIILKTPRALIQKDNV